MKRFQDYARVCFVGDSITRNGIFLKYIVAHYRKNFPKSCVELYNCGIAGGTLGNTLKVYEEDIAIYKPTHIVLLIGVNDSARYHLEKTASVQRYEKLFEAFSKYKINLERFYQIACEQNVELILCTPMPYAEYMKSGIASLHGGYALMQGYASYIREFALKNKIELCDYHVAIEKYMQGEILYDPDRVHPTPRGHELMAQIFLEAQGFSFDASKEFPADIENWFTITSKIRSIITTEYLMVPNYTELNHSERLAVVQKKYEALKNGISDQGSNFESLMETYLIDKPHQEEYIAFVQNFMKSNG